MVGFGIFSLISAQHLGRLQYHVHEYIHKYKWASRLSILLLFDFVSVIKGSLQSTWCTLLRRN